jgi:energy-converting hydrogenase Eha subunit F
MSNTGLVFDDLVYYKKELEKDLNVKVYIIIYIIIYWMMNEIQKY